MYIKHSIQVYFLKSSPPSKSFNPHTWPCDDAFDLLHDHFNQQLCQNLYIDNGHQTHQTTAIKSIETAAVFIEVKRSQVQWALHLF